MSQSNTTPVQLLTVMGPPSGSMALTKRFECEVPGCGKVFRRKEHLTRHLKSHDTQLQYACHICGRRYARSDVLKRHVEFHPQYYKPKREFIACTRCRESKTKCDEEHPCRPCSRRDLECVRLGRSKIIVSSKDVASELPPEVSDPPSNQAQVLQVPTVQEPANMGRRLDVYFTKIHPSWPILQSSTIMPESTGPLVTSIMALVSWLEGAQDHSTLFNQALDEIEKTKSGRNPSLPVLQATVLCLLYAICCLTTEGMVLKAWRIHNDLVSACRLARILIPQRGIWYASNEASTEKEEYKQQYYGIAFAALRLDAYLSAMTDFPPLIRYQELSMSLCHATWWTSVNGEEERRRLQEDETMIRKKTSFGFRVHDLFGTPRPNVLAPPWTKIDYHFILCAIQSGAWEASHQALRTIPEDIQSRTHPQDLRTDWRSHLNTWATNLEHDCELRKHYFKGSRGDDIDPQTLLLWHMTTLKMHAPPDLWGLQQRYYEFDIPLEPQLRHPLRTWQASKIARTAVWHSAQIARIVSGELSLENATTRIRLNPLLIPALLMSAFVVCGYVYHAKTCPLCTGGGPIDLVSLFEASDGCQRLDRWLEEGAGLADWGPDVFIGFPVCQCSQLLLYDWFRKFLAQDTQADAALGLFLDELKAGTW
ncbi:hypothetical protein F5B22DRAFT_599909 [Xylaria bambusicola]|uniref:uncharacterized protein n=1 Tax=Xylaria bambusicola TaxID=326684 RepID=UPI0020081A3B|nr:uncharacterized protein F5B22DRAFT_599909 [Xylaria bambusicola]KAI0518159.1 hypothetical protein F5B22DRAFT_599909 [Xylaria bambusicola]